MLKRTSDARWGRPGAAVAAALVLGVGCISDRPSAGPDLSSSGVTVAIDNFAFVPAELSIPAGTTVTWVNHDPVGHTVTADDGTSFASSAFTQGAMFQVAAGQPGTYTYFCQIHPFMKAKLIVTPAP